MLCAPERPRQRMYYVDSSATSARRVKLKIDFRRYGTLVHDAATCTNACLMPPAGRHTKPFVMVQRNVKRVSWAQFSHGDVDRPHHGDGKFVGKPQRVARRNGQPEHHITIATQTFRPRANNVHSLQHQQKRHRGHDDFNCCRAKHAGPTHAFGECRCKLVRKRNQHTRSTLLHVFTSQPARCDSCDLNGERLVNCAPGAKSMYMAPRIVVN